MIRIPKSLIWCSVSDGQKTQFKGCIIARYIIKISLSGPLCDIVNDCFAVCNSGPGCSKHR